jgi:hypothetical protein
LQSIRSQLSYFVGVYGEYTGCHEGQDQRGGSAQDRQSGSVAGTSIAGSRSRYKPKTVKEEVTILQNFVLRSSDNGKQTNF